MERRNLRSISALFNNQSEVPMLNLASDYVEGAHPKILEKLLLTNLEQLTGYGSDVYCDAAKDKIRKAVGCEHADVFFLVGGTQTNQIVISSLLKPYEGVICADTGHIACHEAGAIEVTGHKVLPLPSSDGKISAEQVREFVKRFYDDGNHTHMVFPGMVYISHPTEFGTLYSLAELTALSAVCHEYHLPLFLDGARLGYGLAASKDLTLQDVARLCDVFYIGGTKVGLLCGEAVVFSGMPEPRHFLTMVKQHGALLAKGRLLGVQFDAAFTDDLYMDMSRHAISMAEGLKAVIRKHSLPFFLETETNQQFIVMENALLKELDKYVVSSFWDIADEDHTVIRLCTSWATTDDQIDELDAIFAKVLKR